MTGNVTDGFMIIVRNWKTVDITLKAGLLDPIVSQRSFNYLVSYTLNGQKYDLNRNKLEATADPEPFSLTAYSTSDGSVSSSQTPKTLSIPVGATMVVTEKLSDEVASAYDIGHTLTNSSSTVLHTHDGDDPAICDSTTCNYFATGTTTVTASDDGDVLTFTHRKKTTVVTIGKIVTADDTSGTFSFTAKLSKNNSITEYPVEYEASGAVVTSTPCTLTTATTDDTNGTITFTLKTGNYIKLKIPIGVNLTVSENSVSGTTDNSLDVYTTTVEAKKTASGDAYTKGTWNEGTRTYSIENIPSDALTVNYTNGPGGSRFVVLRKIGKNGTTISDHSLSGAEFEILQGSKDGSKFKGTDVNGNKNVTTFVSGDSGVIYCGEMTYGTYYIKETTAPSGYTDNAGKYFVVTVSEKGVGYKAGTEIQKEVPAQTIS